MTTIAAISDIYISELLTEFENLGGVIDFKFYKVSGLKDKEAHLLTASKTLQDLTNDNEEYIELVSRKTGFKIDTFFKIESKQLSINDGVPITPNMFMGEHFNLAENKPIIRGQRLFNEFFNYDEEETETNVISMNRFKNLNTGLYAKQGYTDAFLNPPHHFGGECSNFEIGKFFLKFNNYIFGKLNKIVIYSWDTNCSNYFEAGQEWWGSYFWTIYNPEKDWYIGIAASTTD